MLAALLADEGRPVPIETLARRVWSEPPESARDVLYAHIARLRRTLAGACRDSGAEARLRRISAGYVLEVDRDRVDLFRFRTLVEQAKTAEPDERRAALLREALDLWNGPPLADLTSDWAIGVRDSWVQRRLAVTARWARIETALGRASATVDELTALLAQHPLAEAVAAELMAALDATGRRAEALDWYNRIRGRLADELGVEPNATLRDLHVEILRGSHRPAPNPLSRRRSTPPTPAQLSADVTGFVGRTGQIGRLDSHLPEDGRTEGTPITLILGAAGVGKTALAVHWAHRVRDRFPDGQLYVNLRGFDPDGEPLRPIDALGRFLRALGVPADQVPADLEEAAALYRSCLAGRRLLVLLDNASSAGRLRPLIPAAPGCMVLVTSRNRLRGLVAQDGARSLLLEPLSPAEATALLSEILGEDRVRQEEDEARALAAACAHLPLTLRIAATRLAEIPGEPISRYVADLREGDPLSALTFEDDHASGVRATFDLSYRALSAEAQRLFRLLGLWSGTDITAPAAAALADVAVADAERSLDELVTIHLLRQHAPRRYSFNHLLRLYAAQRAQAEEPARDRDAALARMYRHCPRASESAPKPPCRQLPALTAGRRTGAGSRNPPGR